MIEFDTAHRGACYSNEINLQNIILDCCSEKGPNSECFDILEV